VFGAVGSATPTAAVTSSFEVPSLMSTMATYGSTLIRTVGGSCSKAAVQDWSGWTWGRSAISACSFGIDQHRTGHLDRDQGAVNGDMHGVADPRLAGLHQGEGERAA
jgi:hypothetical protein